MMDDSGKIIKIPNLVSTSADFSREEFSEAIEIIKKNNSNGLFMILLKSYEKGCHLDRFIDEKGWSLVHYACLHGSNSILKNLCRDNENFINSVTSEGWSPLQIASFHGHTSIVKLLLSFKNIDINLVTVQGTALHKAVEANYIEIVKLLLESNADIQIENCSGKTCIEISRSQEILEMIPKISGSIIINKSFNIEQNHYKWNAVRTTSKFSQDYQCTLFINLKTGKFHEYYLDSDRISKANQVYKKKIIKIKSIQNCFSIETVNKFYFKIEFNEIILKYYVESLSAREAVVENINKIVKYCKCKEIGIRPEGSSEELKVKNLEFLETVSQIPDKISLKEFNKIKILGSGNFGVVTLVKNKYTDELFALKSSKREKFSRIKFAILECEILKSLSHPFIIKLYWATATERHLNLILEYCEAGDLTKAIAKKQAISEDDCRFILACIVSGLSNLHKNNIVSRDLKPSNILVDSFGYLKLCDFGLAQNRVKGDRMNANLMGSPSYLSPEGILKSKVGKKSDIWSLGIIAYQLTTGKLPFISDNVDELYMNILDKTIIYPPNISLNSKNFIKFILQRNPTARPNIQEVMNHEYFKVVDWQILEKRCYESPGFLRTIDN